MNKKSNQKKEKILMLVSSVFVLSALTLTGVYVKERTGIQNHNSVDFRDLEETPQEKFEEIVETQDTDNSKQANANTAVNPVKEQTPKEDDYVEREIPYEEDIEVESSTAKNVHFSDDTTLKWPIVGNILINFSMDKTVYFPTLDQYRYSPAIVISAALGDRIDSASEGIVSNVFYDEQVGNCVSVDLGDGYELTYGQLQDIAVKKGDFVSPGDFIGNVSEPTKYYAVEGPNVYFKLTKQGEPINPLNSLS